MLLGLSECHGNGVCRVGELRLVCLDCACGLMVKVCHICWGFILGEGLRRRVLPSGG